MKEYIEKNESGDKINKYSIEKINEHTIDRNEFCDKINKKNIARDKFYDQLNQHKINRVYLLIALVLTEILSIVMVFFEFDLLIKNINFLSLRNILGILILSFLNLIMLLIFLIPFILTLNTFIYLLSKSLKQSIKYIQLINLSFLSHSLLILILPFFIIPPLGIVILIFIFIIIIKNYIKILFNICQSKKIYCFMVLFASTVYTFILLSLGIFTIEWSVFPLIST